MVDGASVTVPPQVILPIYDDLTVLKAIDSDTLLDGYPGLVKGIGLYMWDALSMASASGEDVVRPDDRTSLQAGRWLRIALSDQVADVNDAVALAQAAAASAQGDATSATQSASIAVTARNEAEGFRDEAATAAGQALAAAATIGLKIQTNPATPTVPPAGAASGDNYLATEPTASYLILYLNTAGTGAPVLVSGLQVRIPLMNGVQAVIDVLPDIIEALGFETINTRMGVQTLTAGMGTFGTTNYSFLMFQATERTSLVGKDIGLRVGVLGSGAVSLGCYSGNPATGNLTCQWRDALPTVLATGNQVWTAPSTRMIEAGQWLAFDFPTGGVQANTRSGGVSYNRAGLLAPAASGAYGDAAATIEGYIDTEIYAARGITRSEMTAETQTAISLAEAVGTQREVYTGYPGPFDTGNFSSLNFFGQAYVGTATYAGAIEKLDILALTTGDGILQMSIWRGDLSNRAVNIKQVALGPIAAGVNTLQASLGDYAATYLEAGDHVFINRLSLGGPTLALGDLTGSTFYSANGAVAQVGQQQDFSSGPPDTLTIARFWQTAKTLPILPEIAPLMWDMFLVAGQSNAVGKGAGGTPLIRSGIAKQYYSGVLTDLASDPVGNADDASAWPAFANEYYRRTGRGSIFVPRAVLGSGLQAYLGSNWSDTGALRGPAAAAVTAAYNAISPTLPVQFAGVLWIQGETDGDNIDAGVSGVTEAGYTTQLATLKAYFEAQFGFASGMMPFLIAETGQRTTGDTAGWQAVRRAQRAGARTIPGVYLAHTGARFFVARSMMRDPLHYSGSAYTEMGNSFATVSASRCIGNA